MVIICTDGLANKGLGLNYLNLFIFIGSLEDNTSALFYQNIGEIAKQNGITISIISIKGEGCKLETLSSLAEITNGTIKIVAPENLSSDFATILKHEIVGTKV